MIKLAPSFIIEPGVNDNAGMALKELMSIEAAGGGRCGYNLL